MDFDSEMEIWMADETITCVDCRKEFIHTERERRFLEELVRDGKLPEVKTPKRCLDCRSKRRRFGVEYQERPQNGTAVAVAPAASPPKLIKSPEAPEKALAETLNVPPEDIRLILVAGDFENLVCREEVVLRHGNRKVVLRLADIGVEAMKQAMEKAVMKWWKS